jgi:hypothetical protein
MMMLHYLFFIQMTQGVQTDWCLASKQQFPSLPKVGCVIYKIEIHTTFGYEKK